MRKHKARLIVAIFLLIFIFQGLYVCQVKSPTYDETTWLTTAWYITHFWSWQEDYHILLHPPLSFYIHGIPLRLLEWGYQSRDLRPVPEGKLAETFPYPYFEILTYNTVFLLAKIPILLLSAVLGIYIYCWASQLYGRRGGVFAVGVYSLNPYMLAHSTLITTDMVIACFFFIAGYYMWRFCLKPSIGNMLRTGVALGLALSSRVVSLVLLPIWMLMILSLLAYKKYWHPRHSVNAGGEGMEHSGVLPQIFSAKTLIVGLAVSICLGFLILEASYIFDMQPIRAFNAAQRTDMLSRFFGKNSVPLGAFINGLRLHLNFSANIRRTFFWAGEYSHQTWWYYHLVTFILKNPIPLLAFLLVSISFRSQYTGHFLTREYFLLLPAIVFFLCISLAFPMNTSSRFVLPAYPFLFVFVSRVVTLKILKRMAARVVLGALVVWYMLSTLSAFPHYLAYCNEFIGGTGNGYKWFADGSFDWGQDLKGLGSYVQTYRIPVIQLAYFGTAKPEYYGIRYTTLEEPDGCEPTSGVIAISATRLQGVYEENHACYAWLAAYEPIARIGGTIFVYAIKPGEIPGP